MKKLFFWVLFVPVLIGCSSESVQKQTIQMNDVKLSCLYDFMEEEDVRKQMSLFELIPGPQQITVTEVKLPGETWYDYDLYLNVRLKRSVDIDISNILADKERKDFAMSCANLAADLLDRNGEKIQIVGPFGASESTLYSFSEYWADSREDYFVDYLTFLQSEPGTVFTLHFVTSYSDQKFRCSVGLPNLIKEVKGVELQIEGIDNEFEKYVGEIK